MRVGKAEMENMCFPALLVNGLQLHRTLVKYVKVDYKSSSLEAKFIYIN